MYWSNGTLITWSKKLNQKPERTNKTPKTESYLKAKGSRWDCWFSRLSSNKGGGEWGKTFQVAGNGWLVFGRREKTVLCKTQEVAQIIRKTGALGEGKGREGP